MARQHVKEIKRRLRKMVKKHYPHYRSFPKKQKKKILDQILEQILMIYDTTQPVNTDKYELCGVEQIPKNIYTINQLEQLLHDFNAGILPFKLRTNKKLIKDPELQFINDLCDWAFINNLIKPENYSPAHREKFPVQLFKAELLKSLKYPELSYRRYCEREINNKERKENRAFIGLKSGEGIYHSQLSTFRSKLPYHALINVMVYFIFLFLNEKRFANNIVYAIDSTELAEKINPFPILTIKYNNEDIRIYQDIDADCGSRRSKRDKASFVVGYRLHTLTVIDIRTQMAYPLISILASANHHDSQFLEMLVHLGKAIGLEMNVVIGDQAYGKKEENDEIRNKHNITILNQPKEIKNLPENVDPNTYQVLMNDCCEIAMEYSGKDDEFGHEFHCAAEYGQCLYADNCTQIRFIPVDTGVFGQIPYQYKQTQELCKMRKVAERPYNLLKHREGLEPLKTLTYQTTRTVTVIANIATLLIELAGYRHKKHISKNEQLELILEAA